LLPIFDFILVKISKKPKYNKKLKKYILQVFASSVVFFFSRSCQPSSKMSFSNINVCLPERDWPLKRISPPMEKQSCEKRIATVAQKARNLALS